MIQEMERLQGDLRVAFLYLRGAVRKKGTDLLAGSVVIELGEMISNLKSVDAGWI